jgi:hypothetical protein
MCAPDWTVQFTTPEMKRKTGQWWTSNRWASTAAHAADLRTRLSP